MQLVVLGVLAVACTSGGGYVPAVHGASDPLAEGLRRQLLKNNYDYADLSLESSPEQTPAPPAGPPPPSPRGRAPPPAVGPAPPPVDQKDLLYYMDDTRLHDTHDSSDAELRLNSTKRAQHRMFKMGDGRRHMSERRFAENQDPELPFSNEDILQPFLESRGYDPYRARASHAGLEPAPPPPPPVPQQPPAPHQPPTAEAQLSDPGRVSSEDWNSAELSPSRRSAVNESRMSIEQYRSRVQSRVRANDAPSPPAGNQTRRLAPAPESDWDQPRASPAPDLDKQRYLIPSDMAFSDIDY